MKGQRKFQKYKMELSHQKKSKQNEKQQSNQDFQLKMQNIQREISSLNLDIESLLKQKTFKENTQKALIKQRKKLESCFLFKNFQANNQLKLSQEEEISNQSSMDDHAKNKVKNQFRDVNQTILRYIKQLQSLKDIESQKKNQNYSDKQLLQSEQASRKLECQSLHLKQIFNPEQNINHEEKSLRLQQKLNLLYQKIKINLEREQPYLSQKIFDRIKRQAQSYTRKKLLQQIDKLIKDNSKWISQETNRVSNNLQQKKVQQVCVNNVGLMKRIMQKKVSNNDWIYQNYDDKYMNKGYQSMGFPIQRMESAYKQIVKKIRQKGISDKLIMVSREGLYGKQEENMDEDEGLKELLGSQTIERLMQKSLWEEKNRFQQSQNVMIEKVYEIKRKIQGMIKE